MIEKSMLFIQQYLNTKLQQSFGTSNEIITLGNITPSDNTSTPKPENKLLITVLNIQQEPQRQFAPYIRQAGQITDPNADKPISLNLFLMVSVNCTSQQYITGLSLLSKVISIIESNATFSSSEYPGIDTSIHKIILETYNAPLSEMTSIWTSMGVNCKPSIIYKARVMGVIQENKQPMAPL